MDEEGWCLTPEGEEYSNNINGEILKMTGMDKIREGVKTKFDTRHWILVEQDNSQVEVWSVVDNETVMLLDEHILSNSHDKAGNLFPANDKVFLFIALRMIAGRDGKDHELTPEGIRVRKWLQTLPIDNDVIDGSCFDNYWKEHGIDSPEK